MSIELRQSVQRTLCRGVALLAFGAGVTSAQEVSDEDWLREVIVTAPRMQSPLIVSLDAKVPRQPLPAHDGADYLKTVSGFSVIRKGGTDGDPVFRGMAASRINLLLDGEQILGGCGMRMDPPTAYVFPESYDRIVIIKGPQTVLHGPGNSAATVLFERDPPAINERDLAIHASAVAASAARSDVVADITGGVDHFYGRLSMTRAEADDYEDGAGRAVHSSYLRWSGNGEIGWTPNDQSRVVLTAARSDGEAAYADRLMDGAMFARSNLGLRFELEEVTDTIRKLEGQVFYNYVDHVMDNYSLREFVASPMMDTRAASNPDRRTTGARVAVTLARERGIEATIGVDAQENVHRIRSTSNQTLMPYQVRERVEDGRFQNVGAFGEATWSYSDASRIVSGVRVDHWEARDSRIALVSGMGMSAMLVPNPTAGKERTSVLPSGFARWEHDFSAPATKLYVGVGHVERFPDYWELLPTDRESVTSMSAFDTRPEKTTQLDTGVVYRAQRLELSVGAFYNRIDDYILIQSGYGKGMRRVSVSRNVDATTLGAEADAAFAIGGGWKLTGSLAYTRGENDTDDLPLAQLAPLEARLGIDYARERWTIGTLARWAADQERYVVNQGNVAGQDLGRTDGFATLAVNASWQMSRSLAMSAGIDNLFDREYAEHLSRGGASLAGYPQTVRVNEPGRTMWLRFGAEF